LNRSQVNSGRVAKKARLATKNWMQLAMIMRRFNTHFPQTSYPAVCRQSHMSIQTSPMTLCFNAVVYQDYHRKYTAKPFRTLEKQQPEPFIGSTSGTNSPNITRNTTFTPGHSHHGTHGPNAGCWSGTLLAVKFDVQQNDANCLHTHTHIHAYIHYITLHLHLHLHLHYITLHTYIYIYVCGD